MEGRNFSNKQENPAKTTQPLFSSLVDNQNGLPNCERNESHNQQRQSISMPLISAPSIGPKPVVDNADGLNNIQGNDNAPNPSNEIPPATHIREHDMYLPTANVVRIMRRGLPVHAKVADDAKETVQECVSEFISFITSEANEACQLERRKTITAEDVIGAMAKLGFDHYVEPLWLYLQKHRESDMIPPVNKQGSAHGGNTGLDYDQFTPRPGDGPIGLMPTNDGLPPFALIHPQYAMFASGYYQDGSGPSSGPMCMLGFGPNAVTIACEGNGPNMGLDFGNGSGGSDGVGPSGSSSRDGPGFYDPYSHYK